MVYSAVHHLRSVCPPKAGKHGVLFCNDLIFSESFVQHDAGGEPVKALLPLQLFTGSTQRVVLVEDNAFEVLAGLQLHALKVKVYVGTRGIV